MLQQLMLLLMLLLMFPAATHDVVVVVGDVVALFPLADVVASYDAYDANDL